MATDALPHSGGFTTDMHRLVGGPEAASVGQNHAAQQPPNALLSEPEAFKLQSYSKPPGPSRGAHVSVEPDRDLREDRREHCSGRATWDALQRATGTRHAFLAVRRLRKLNTEEQPPSPGLGTWNDFCEAQEPHKLNSKSSLVSSEIKTTASPPSCLLKSRHPRKPNLAWAKAS